MNWYRYATVKNEESLKKDIKSLLKRHPFLRKLRDDYLIPEKDIDNHLTIEFMDLDGKFAEGNGEEIRIDKGQISDNFMNDKFHFVVHEFYHWVRRRSEDKFYFNDPEEIQSFILAIAWELINGTPKNDIADKLLPIVAAHYKDSKKGKAMFSLMFNKASELAGQYNG